MRLMNFPAIAQIILIHLPTIALAATLVVLFRALRNTATDRPERATLFTGEDTIGDWQRRTQLWQERLRIIRQLASVNAICLSACIVTLLSKYAFPPLLVAGFTIVYLLVITPYLLKKIPFLKVALESRLSPQQ